MDYKLIALDLDGTLLTKFKHISSKDLRALKNYANKGGKVIIATGRAIYSATYYKNIIEKRIGIKIPFIISLCGSYIKSFENPVDSKFSTIPDKIVKEIDLKAQELNVYSWIYTVKEIDENYVLCNWSVFVPFAKILKKLNVKKFDHNRDLEAFKINVFGRSKYNITKLAKYLSEKYSDVVSFTYTGEHHLEICAKNISKGSAIRYIANKLNIKLNEVGVFGDTGNDLPAFKTAKFSAAINSKSDTLKANASVEIPNFRSGVACAINKYINNDEFKQVKLITTDLDGTLLTDETKEIVLETVSAIKSFVENNKPYFCISTGRNVADANRFLERLNLPSNVKQYIIADNGAVLYSLSQKCCIRFRGMPNHIANKILNIIKDCNTSKKFGEIGAFIHTYDEQDTNNSIASGYKTLIKKYGYNKDFVINQILKKTPKFFGPKNPSSNIIEIDNIEDGMRPTKFVLKFVDSKQRQNFFNYIQTFNIPLEFSTSGETHLEINTLNVNKGKAIKTLIEELNIEPTEVMAIGNETNDITILKLTEWSFCTSKCNQAVLDNTRHIVDSKPSYIVKDAIDMYLKEYNKNNGR